LDDVTVEAREVVMVPPGTRTLRVALNGRDDGVSDFDLYVKAGAPATIADADCRRAGASQFALCEIAEPAVGAWHVLVRRFSGAGEFQVTVTTFAATPTAPAAGAACDDGNPRTAADQCRNGRCTGTALTDGAPCEGGTACGERCLAGACRPLQCRHPTAIGRARLALRTGRKGPVGDDFTWTWAHGAATGTADFGDPRAQTAYVLQACQRSASGDMQVIAQQRIPAGSSSRRGSPGRRRTKRGFSYRGLAPRAVDRVALAAGDQGKARISLHARGAALALAPLPPRDDAPIVVQLLGDQVCWEAEYRPPARASRRSFLARGE
jgi:hypothetical protein